MQHMCTAWLDDSILEGCGDGNNPSFGTRVWRDGYGKAFDSGPHLVVGSMLRKLLGL